MTIGVDDVFGPPALDLPPPDRRIAQTPEQAIPRLEDLVIMRKRQAELHQTAADDIRAHMALFPRELMRSRWQKRLSDNLDAVLFNTQQALALQQGLIPLHQQQAAQAESELNDISDQVTVRPDLAYLHLGRARQLERKFNHHTQKALDYAQV